MPKVALNLKALSPSAAARQEEMVAQQTLDEEHEGICHKGTFHAIRWICFELISWDREGKHTGQVRSFNANSNAKIGTENFTTIIQSCPTRFNDSVMYVCHSRELLDSFVISCACASPFPFATGV